jgi:hypothetical protein
VKVTQQATSSNFSFIGARYPESERIGARSERYFSEDSSVKRWHSLLLRAQVYSATPKCRPSALVGQNGLIV